MRPITLCLACQSEIGTHTADTYVICEQCATATYISDKNAEEDNKNYFNNHQVSVNIPSRSFLFSAMNRIDQLSHLQEFLTYNKLLRQIEDCIDNAPVSVEIGFGGGDELNRRLARGANCYGIDLSSTVVEAYKKNFPRHADRVACEAAGKSSITCDLIYSNALFEHLDNPDDFLHATHDQLKTGGILAIRIPIKMDVKGSIPELDINFWKPCHRALYSLKGFETILNRNGFRITQQATLSYYGYKVMNRLLKLGFMSLHEIRSPYAEIPNLTMFNYLKSLGWGLFEKPICVEYAALAIKV